MSDCRPGGQTKPPIVLHALEKKPRSIESRPCEATIPRGEDLGKPADSLLTSPDHDQRSNDVSDHVVKERIADNANLH